ncbi:hypothetical protein J6590_088381 [Homalodisca vitripennis]|nr:hypothetical protein J6590_088381 [Homalodisca vitripennis]
MNERMTVARGNSMSHYQWEDTLTTSSSMVSPNQEDSIELGAKDILSEALSTNLEIMHFGTRYRYCKEENESPVAKYLKISYFKLLPSDNRVTLLPYEMQELGTAERDRQVFTKALLQNLYPFLLS